jgi:peptidoglycan/LPS O-acetylase OafA/YrhL
MYHMFVIIAMAAFLGKIPLISQNEIAYNLAMYLGSFVITMLVSAASYELFESKFQHLKRHFPRNKSIPTNAVSELAVAAAVIHKRQN